MEQAKPLKIGVVGCGFFARNHLYAWRDLAARGGHLAAVCDLDRAKAAAVAEEFGLPGSYDDIGRMLAEAEIDIVDIVTQVDSHRPLVAAALAAGKAVIVQKPFGTDLADCEAMTDLARAGGGFLAVHENFRFQAPSQRIKQAIGAGRIGHPNWGRIAFRTGFDVFVGQPYLATVERLVISDLGVHVLDLARFFFGEAAHVSAETQTRIPNITGEDTATMLVRHVSGAVTMVECTYASFHSPDPFPVTQIEIEGDRGGIRLGGDLSLRISSPDGVADSVVGAPSRDWTDPKWLVIQDSVYETCANILAAVQAGRPAETSAEDNLKTFALCEAAYEAAASGRAVKPRH